MSSMRALRREPTLLDLRDLERIGDRRAEIEALEAGDDGPAHRRRAAVRRLLLATLDEMEEQLCLYGWRARRVVAGWRRLAELEASGRDGETPALPEKKPARRRRSQPRRAGETPALPATNQDGGRKNGS